MIEPGSIDWQLLLSPLLDPTHRLFWPFLLSSLALAVLAWGWERAFSQQESEPGGLLAFLFPSTVWLHRSALLDYRLLIFKQVTRLLLVIPWGLTTFTATAWVVHRLHDLFGSPSTPAVEPWLLTLVYSAVLFLVWDLSRYILHRLLHRLPLHCSGHGLFLLVTYASALSVLLLLVGNLAVLDFELRTIQTKQCWCEPNAEHE